jgi:hypothetical protein
MGRQARTRDSILQVSPVTAPPSDTPNMPTWFRSSRPASMSSERSRSASRSSVKTARWPLRSVALAGIALAFLETDPDTVWTEERVAAIRHRLTAVARAHD